MKGFGYFIKDGTLKEMRSTIPPVTAAAWPSIYTGKEPREHGIMDFLHIDRNYTRQLIYYEPEKHNPFWEVLARKGVKSLLVTPPMVLQRSKSSNVDLITGWPLEPRYSSKELENAAKRFGFKGEPDIGVDLDKGTLPLAKGSAMYIKSMKARSELSKHLIMKKDYDVIFVCFTETDRIQHYSMNRKDWEKYLAPIYKQASDFIEWVVDYSKSKGEKATIMLMSDHGAQPVKEKFLANTWLVDQKYASIKPEKTAAKAKGISSDAKKYASELIMKMPMRRQAYNLLPASLKKNTEKMIESSLEIGSDKDHIKIAESDLIMEKTKAFAAVSYGPCGMIWINDHRFSKPGVKNSDSRKTKTEIMSKLSKLKARDGSKLVSEIIDGRDHYKGAEKFIAPDIVFLLKDNHIVDFSYYSSKGMFMKPEIYRSGDHTVNGIFGFIGRWKSAKQSIYDIHKEIIDYFS